MSNLPEAAAASSAPLVSPPPTETPYRPVSLLATCALVLAVGYGIVLLVGILFSLMRHDAFLLPVFSFIVPMGALLMAWLAQTQIQASEGTLTGLPLCRWAIRLSLLFGMLYGAYYSASNLAIRHQADSYCKQWLDLIKQGKQDEAFFLTIPAPRPTYTPVMRTMLEGRFNGSTDFTKPESLSGFAQQNYVRFLQNGGADVKIGPGIVTSCVSEKGGVLVTLNYKIDTPLVQFTLEIAAQGTDGRAADPRSEKTTGRQWRIMLGSTRIDLQSPTGMRMTPEGNEILPLLMSAKEIPQEWIENLHQGNSRRCFELGCPTADRQRLGKTYAENIALGSVLGWDASRGLFDAKEQDYLDRFRSGQIINLAPDFWASPDVEGPLVLEDARRLLTSPGSNLAPTKQSVLKGTAPLPLFSHDKENERYTLRYDYQLILDRHTLKQLPLILECQVIVSGVVKTKNPAEIDWQVQGMEVVRARILQPPGTGARGPGGPGGPPGGPGGPGRPGGPTPPPPRGL